MIVKALRMENIRSYSDTEIEFPLGTTLFEGDIGSGKTTLLMAIEFALFGLGSERGAALLRTGRNEGSVNLKFEVEGEEYEVQRTLVKKGRWVQQGEGYIKSKEGILRLSPSELKQKMLQILKFNEPPDPKAHSVIYRYAVFTPQEEMKTVLNMRSDERLQTLRKAFRIEDYKVARDNAKNLTSAIRRQSDSLKDKAYDLDEKRETWKRYVEEVNGYRKQLKGLKAKEQSSEKELQEVKEKQDKMQKKRNKLSKIEGLIPQLKERIKEKTLLKADQKTTKETITVKIRETKTAIDELEKMHSPTEKTLNQLNTGVEKLEEEKVKLVQSQSTSMAKIKDYKHIEEEGACPTCDREVNSSTFKTKIEEKQRELKRDRSSLEEIQGKIDEQKRLIEKKRNYVETRRRVEESRRLIEEQQKMLREANSKTRQIEKETEQLEKQLKDAIEELKKLEDLSKRLVGVDRQVQRAEEKLREVSSQALSIKVKIQEGESRIKDLKNEIRTKEDSIRKSEFLHEHVIWIDDYFSPTLENIEKHVLITINQEFNNYFQHWFSMLVVDPTKDARVDEDFTPIIEQDGVEQNVYYLSGGERTSVALAYRLALNTMVRKVSTGIRSNLLILDEPTDGFSKDQLFRIQDILGELECPQIIMVSHEKELESFADQVFKVSKVNGTSKVTA